MKKILIIGLILTYFEAAAQTSNDLKNAVKDYSFTMYNNFRWGTDAFKFMMVDGLRRQYYDPSEILKGMEKIDTDIEFRKATYRIWKRLSDENVDLYNQFRALGMSRNNSIIIARHILEFKDAPVTNSKSSTISLSRFKDLMLIDDKGLQTGKVVVSFTVDKRGAITNVKIDREATTIINDPELLKQCENAVKNAKLEPIKEGPEIRSLSVAFNFKIK